MIRCPTDAVRRETLRREARRIRIARTKREEAVSRLNHLRRELFFESGVRDEQEFRQRALQCAQAEALQRDREAVAREIEAALGSQCSENDVRRQLEPEEHAAARGGPAHAAADLRVAAAEVPHFGCAEVSNFGCAEVPRQ